MKKVPDGTWRLYRRTRDGGSSWGAQAQVDSVKHIPSALALHQRPAVPSERALLEQ